MIIPASLRYRQLLLAGSGDRRRVLIGPKRLPHLERLALHHIENQGRPLVVVLREIAREAADDRRVGEVHAAAETVAEHLLDDGRNELIAAAEERVSERLRAIDGVTIERDR